MNSRRLMLISFTFTIALSLCLVSPSCSKKGLTINSAEEGLTFAMNNNMKDKQNMLPKIFLWRSGKKTKLNSKQQWVIQLITECEKLFTSGNNVLREIVTKWTLEEAKSKEALEIIYPKPIKFRVAIAPGTLCVDGLLIPLNPLHNNTAVIYHRMGSYSAGPVINTRGKIVLDKIKQILKTQDYRQ